MKKHLLIYLALSLILVACAQATPTPIPSGNVLHVTNGVTEKIYTSEDLKALPAFESVFLEVGYVGVTLKVLLEDAGFDPSEITAVKAVALDGFSANYDRSLIFKEDTIIAYSRVDGPLADDEKPFRMVLPGQGGSMNVRLLRKIQVIP